MPEIRIKRSDVIDIQMGVTGNGAAEFIIEELLKKKEQGYRLIVVDDLTGEAIGKLE
jgi:hypothetical protein